MSAFFYVLYRQAILQISKTHKKFSVISFSLNFFLNYVDFSILNIYIDLFINPVIEIDMRKNLHFAVIYP